MSVIAVEGAGGFSPCSHSTADSERRPLFLFSLCEPGLSGLYRGDELWPLFGRLCGHFGHLLFVTIVV